MQDRGSTGSFGLKKQIDPPQVDKFGTKRVAWSNFSSNCKSCAINYLSISSGFLSDHGHSLSTRLVSIVSPSTLWNSFWLSLVPLVPSQPITSLSSRVVSSPNSWKTFSENTSVRPRNLDYIVCFVFIRLMLYLASLYSAEYVICRTCKSPNTELSKENRLTFKKCKDCGATSTVAAIKSGFRAQTKRKKE
jgi:hypothetical protein